MVIERVELRFVQLVILLYFSIKSLQRFEEIPLVGVIEGLAKVQILQLVTLAWARCQARERQEPDH